MPTNNIYPNPCATGAGGYNMGMGLLGDPAVEIKRKFRWLMAIDYCRLTPTGGFTKTVKSHFLKTSSRPELQVDDGTELNFLNSKTWIAGKASWQPITVTYIDVATDDNIDLWSWIGNVYNFYGTDPCYTTSKRFQYEGQATIQVLDGCGFVQEQWKLSNAWPTNIKFGTLEYQSSDTLDIEMTMRYSNVSYNNYCGGNPAPCACAPCSPASVLATFFG